MLNRVLRDGRRHIGMKVFQNRWENSVALREIKVWDRKNWT